MDVRDGRDRLIRGDIPDVNRPEFLAAAAAAPRAVDQPDPSAAIARGGEPPDPPAIDENGDSAGPDAILSALDPEQREVALATRGPVCVLAGAGTGKTRAIAHRIAYQAAIGVTNPARVLAVTFTTRAAGELRGRLRQLSQAAPSAGLGKVQARTFHAAALRQLTHFWPAAIGGPAPRVLDSKISLVAEAARRLRISTGLAELRDAAAEIEWAKVTQVRPDDYASASAKAARTPPLDAAAVARIYALYEELRAERNVVDFESVLELTAAILAENPDVAAAVRERYATFVVDEYQDVNSLQKLLLDMWLGGRDDVCVVGDPRQTIYSFTGATPSYLTGFPAEFPGATVIRLVRNYRSTPQVVTLANSLVTAWPGTGRQRRAVPGRDPHEAPLVAQRPAGPPPQLTAYPDEPGEAAAVAAQARSLMNAGTPAAQIAVLVRTNAQTQVLEHALAEAGVPFQVRGAERFFERGEVRQAVGLLRGAARASSAADGPAAGQVRAILGTAGLTPQPPGGRGTARERWESLEALAQLADDYFAASPAAGLADLADELTVRSAIGHAPALAGVTVASLHAAKGLEWDVVFLAGLTDGTVPIIYAQTDEAIEEERRLLYVGVTRARQRLFLSWALARAPGGRRTRQPSRFLDGLTRGAALQADGSAHGGSAHGGSAHGGSAHGGSARDGSAHGGAGRRRKGQPDAGPEDPLFARLRAWRLDTAREQDVPAFVVFSDATLRAIAERRPANRAELAGVPGVGAVKLDRYGSAVLELCAEDPTPPDRGQAAP